MRQLRAAEIRAFRRRRRWQAGAWNKTVLRRYRVSPAEPSDRCARSSSAASVERDPPKIDRGCSAAAGRRRNGRRGNPW